MSLKETSAPADLNIGNSESEALKILDRGSIKDRIGLAQKLAFSKSADRTVVLRLARDEIEVAAQILEHSPLLSPEDQLALLNMGSESHWRVLAKRTDISDRIAMALLNTKSAIVAKTLANNHSCNLSNEARSALLQLSKSHRALQISLLLRPDLTTKEAAQMRAWVSDALAQFVSESFAAPKRDEVRALEAGTEPSLGLVTQCQRAGDVDAAKIVNDLAQSGMLRPSILMKALHGKNDELFVASIAKLLEVSAGSMKSFLAGYRAPRLAIACHAAGINQDAFRTMYLLVRHLHGRYSDVQSEELEEAAAIYGLSSAQAHQEIREICA